MRDFDFTGFSFGDWNSHEQDEVVVYRVSSGDGYDIQLHPEIKDKMVEVPGMDGSYYFGSDYGPKVFDIEIAFDHLTEEQLRQLRRVFGTKEIKSLVFDEYPYKYYLAKLESPIELSYICFDERRRRVGKSRKGIRRNGYTYDTKVLDETIVIPAEETIEYELEYAPIDSIITFISGEDNISNWSIEDKLLVLTNSTAEDVIIVVSYSYVDPTPIPSWENVEPYEYLETTERIYKGKGKISLICYFPFAKSMYKQLPTTEEDSDWAISSGILPAYLYNYFDKYIASDELVINAAEEGLVSFTDSERFKDRVDHTGVFHFTYELNGDVSLWKCNNIFIDSLDEYGIEYNEPDLGASFTVYYQDTGIINIYNAGDIRTGFRLYCAFDASHSIRLTYFSTLGESTAQLNVDEITPINNDIGFLINTTNGLIQGVTEITEVGENTTYTTSGNIYNKYVDSGFFFQLEPNELYTDGAQIQITNFNNEIIHGDIRIFYDYLYF